MNATDSNNADNADSAVAQDPRRLHPRFPIDMPFLVVPLDRDHKTLRTEAFDAIGINASKQGLAVSHTMPMRYSRAVINATGGAMLGHFSVEAEVAWTK